MSEDVSRFLEQVRELGDRRAEEDEARSRELEEKILADRKERQARRAERARSISPQKSSPANTPPPANQRAITPASPRLDLEASPIIEPPASPQTPSNPAHADTMAAQAFYSESASKENESPFDAENKRASNPLSPSRSATVRGLNWQRRPNSQASNGPRSRPLSVVAAENAARSSTTSSEPASATEAISRDQIAQSLLSKDPSWFRQTADRGTTSGAYRKSQVEDVERTDVSSGRTQLPGMGRRPSADPSQEEATTTPGSPSLPRGLGSPLSLATMPRLDPSKNEGTADIDETGERQSLTTAPSGLTSPARADRPVSPTKGMGGFVQSAMMKRNDSVNKRWSVQSPGGLQRADSVISNRSSYIASRGVTGQSRPTSRGREYSADAISRPGSSYGKTESHADELSSKETGDTIKSNTSSREADAQDEDKTTPPTSPSKTMDPKRWSPTKSSWLESALNKPESPKPKAPSQPTNQPAWLAEIAKAKAQKAANPSGEISRAATVSHKHQVSIGGLARASAPGIGASPTIATHRTGGYRNSISEPAAPVIATHRTGYGRNSVSIPFGNSETGNIANQAVDRAGTSTPVAPSKSKPETPPKKDFRTNLKPRQPLPASNDQGNSDFRSVIGSLRRTTTQNYVAPDELKSNILRGKAGLNLTGGPKKTERKDEFKEAILAKKKEFSVVQSDGRGVTRSSSTASEQPIPEGLVKRFEMQRRNTLKRDGISPDILNTLQGKQQSGSSMPSSEDRRPSTGTQQESTPDVTKPKGFEAPASQPVLPKDINAPGQLHGKISGSALANRFNPALAGLLARGPPSTAPGQSNEVVGSSAQGRSSDSGNGNTEPTTGPKLTHMTKSRARGPKRKAPTSVTTPAADLSISEIPTAPNNDRKEEASALKSASPVLEDAQVNAPAVAPTPEVSSPKEPPKREYSWQAKPKPDSNAVADSQKPSTDPAQEQSTRPPRPGRSHVRTKSRVFEQVAAFTAQSNPSSPTKQHESDQTGSQPPSPKKLDMKRMSKFGGESSPEKSPDREALRDVRAPPEDLKPKPLFSKPEPPRTPKPEIQSPPPQLFSRPLPEPEHVRSPPASLTPDSKRFSTPNDGVTSFAGRALPTIPPPSVSTPAKPRPLSMMTKPSPRPLPIPGSMSPAPLASPMRSPTKQAAETTSALNDFFGHSRPRRNYNVDAAELLMQRPIVSAPSIQSLSAQLFQLSAGGKRVPVAAHHDRVLFEREMYLCSHTFNNEVGKKISEVYFWVGDEVPSSVVEDVSIFVSREAKVLGGTLVQLRQNKESPQFIAALGGIVITRRGSSNKYDSLAPHMLCGRRYQGQIVFDEVDYTPTALCSGFPYLVTSSGKCYLWKGKGSGADELSCARLIGMDYALSGELEEIEDGHEPTHFWSLFGGGSRLGSADHWRLKPNYDGYCSRLFRSDASSRQQIVELSPLSQKDLDKTGIYVLDAFFELYIIVGANAQPQYASFHNALEFAQEYAILVASMEDRPFVPVSTVILEGIPKDMKSVFRKWRDADSPTIMNPSGGGTGLRRGRSLRIVPLNAALLALRD